MKFSSIAVSTVFAIISLAGRKADAQPKKPEKHQEFVSDASASFNEPANNRGVNHNRLVVTMTDTARVPPMRGAKQGVTFDNGAHTVFEFDKDSDREEFLAQAERAGVIVEEDPPIFPLEVQVDHDVSRNLAEETPWGISDVFKRGDGTVDIPGPDYYPAQTRHVCIIDSGYQLNHPDLVNTAQNADPSQGSTYNVDGCKHGTHVAGTILATDNDIGVIGVFPGAKAWIVKVFGSNGSTSCGWSYSSSLVAAAQHCRDRGADIISMSLGGGGSSTFESNAFQALNDVNGILSIAAAGNAGSVAFSYPASYDSIMSVGATKIDGTIASFSQFNSQVDISGPGVNVKSTTGSSGYSSYSGTSMATPHVSGVALLLWNKYPSCTNNEIREALESSALDAGSPGKDIYFGHGIVRYWAAVDFLTTKPCGTTSPPTISPQPTSAPTPCQGASFELDLLTDNYGGETSWKLERGSEQVLQGSGYSSNTAYNVEDCLGQAGEYKFTINDSYGDGICCGYGSGSYEVTVAGVVEKSGGQFSSTESFTFNVNLNPTSPPVSAPTVPPTVPPTPPPTKAPTPSPTKNPTAAPTPSPSISPSTSPTATCESFELSMKTDMHGGETTWELQSNNAVVASGGPYDNDKQYTVTECIPSGAYKFVIKDSDGDGICCEYGAGSYSLKLGGRTFLSGGNFADVEVTEFSAPLAPKTCKNFKVELQTDYNGKETQWSLMNGGTEVLSGGPYSSNRIHTVDGCLDPGTYTFKISDSFGDGMCCKYGPGYYKLWLEGTEIKKGGEFLAEETETFTA